MSKNIFCLFLWLIPLIQSCTSIKEINRVESLDCTVDYSEWVIYEDHKLNYTIQIPASWVILDGPGVTLFRFRDYPREETDPYIYVEEYPRNGAAYEDVVKPYLSDELWATFEFQQSTYNNYPAYVTTNMPSAEGAYSVFIEVEERYLTFALTPWRDGRDIEYLFGATEEEMCLFQAALRTVVVGSLD